jgi:hypothetical protein
MLFAIINLFGVEVAAWSFMGLKEKKRKKRKRRGFPSFCNQSFGRIDSTLIALLSS